MRGALPLGKATHRWFRYRQNMNRKMAFEPDSTGRSITTKQSIFQVIVANLDGERMEHYYPSNLLLGTRLGQSNAETFLLQQGWTSMRGIVGDTAHSALIEDAATFGRLFLRLSNRQILNAYQEIRHAQTSSTQDYEYQTLSLPYVDAADGRDMALKGT
ncbi:hypothetical protein B0H13DRAFT_1859257 [Mycena leptocephala]|nr:hypothetical protein B0H13DRAFT_1859257 [Mycena leptocephala]